MAKTAPSADGEVQATDNVFDAPSDIGGISGARLRSFIERIERLREEVRALQADIREVKAEAKGSGFDVKVINHLISVRAQDADDRDEFETLVDVYARAIGMLR